MNEVKELVEELRNKKSRDNRDLFDRSADMIERLAKELCDKSGCHHKCHDTKDCVVEDEAREYLPSTLTNDENVSKKSSYTEHRRKYYETKVKNNPEKMAKMSTYHAEWQRKNRDKWNAYQKEWAKRKKLAEGEHNDQRKAD